MSLDLDCELMDAHFLLLPIGLEGVSIQDKTACSPRTRREPGHKSSAALERNRDILIEVQRHTAPPIPMYRQHHGAIDLLSSWRYLCPIKMRRQRRCTGVLVITFMSVVEPKSHRFPEVKPMQAIQIKNEIATVIGVDNRGGTIQIEMSASGPFAQCCIMDNGSSCSSQLSPVAKNRHRVDHRDERRGAQL